MRFLSKIRERQFAKKMGGAYNLSRAILAGVLAAGCLMPGFAEAAVFKMDGGTKGTDYTEVGNIATIIKDIIGDGYREIYWKPGYPGASVEYCTINVNNKNIEPSIYIYGGYTGGKGAVTGNTVEISGNTTFGSTSNISPSNISFNIHGGWSQGSGDVTYNKVTISDNTKFEANSYIYGGNSSDGKAENNAVEISDKTTFGSTSNIYGGKSSGGDAENNAVEIRDKTTFKSTSWIYGGRTSGNGTVTGNKVKIIGNTTFNEASHIYGGESTGGKANKNEVEIIGNTTFTAYSEIYGGLSSGNVIYDGLGDVTDNKVTIKDTTFNGASHIYGAEGITAAEGNIVDIKGSTFNDYGYVRGGYSRYKDANDNIVSISESTLKGSVYGGYGNKNANGNIVSISDSTFTGNLDVWGGYSRSGTNSTANNNKVIISGGTVSGGKIYGGKSESGTASENSVSISGGTINSYVNLVYGGYGKTAAEDNIVDISGGTFYNIVGGFATSSSGTASGNSVIISGGTINGYVYGGSSSGTAKDNKVILVGKDVTYKFTDTQGTGHTLTGSGNIEITDAVFGGSGTSNRSGNAIHVYGSNTKVGNIVNFDNLNFYINNKMTYDDVMLKITGQGETDISESNVIVNVDGAPKAKGDLNTITLIQKTDEDEGSIIKAENTNITVNFGPALTGTGSVALTEDQKDLVLTLNVEKTTVNENGKSLVETRAAAAFVVNNMSDFMLGQGMEQAKAAAGGVTPIDAGTMAPFATVGGSNMRYTTGSYVDINGWNGAVGLAKQADKLLFGVAVEHGRGNYDSYLDNGVHASGDIKSTGGLIFGEYKLDNGVHYDAALRAGRVKSDYNSTATSYDESSTYYGFSLGGGKELTVSDKATLDVYGRYYFSHTNGSDVSLANNEAIIDFDAVNSHRLRIGGRYTTTLTEKSKAYAGLAWQYEFGGDAKAAINGYSAPTPSLQGHSAIVEAGYKLNAGKNLTLDFNLNGAMGKQRGIGGGIGAQWLF